jgi:hypothetical protein
VYCSTGTAMNPHESENYLPISRSFSASKWCRDFLGRDISGTTFLRIESSLIQSNSRDLATAICTHVSKDTGSNSCERKIFRPSVHFFLSIFRWHNTYILLIQDNFICNIIHNPLPKPHWWHSG